LILRKGQWFGKGSVLTESASLGEGIEIDLEISEDQDGWTLTGRVLEGPAGDVSIRVAPNEVGTYTIDARVASVAVDGVAKLESEPNLALLWNEGQTQSVTLALFQAGNGIGCRGFLREGGHTLTWEILFKLKQQVVGGSNVVSLANRRR
jgi:hypothetical protein